MCSGFWWLVCGLVMCMLVICWCWFCGWLVIVMCVVCFLSRYS